ncbi:hypothetical protein AX17_006251 [Amanita inopinata Kibby_2008]|nr:hypothetical protein AX17_006251 [Amanita inopinata Kibby_2008]
MDDSEKHGTKRKKSPLSMEDLGPRLRRKLHHELAEVRKSAKKAKTFEIRKIVKKLKFLRSKEHSLPEVKSLEAQLVILKELSSVIVGNTALASKARKNKFFRSTEHVEAAIDEEIGFDILTTALAGSPQHIAQSKLLSSKGLAEQVATAIHALEHMIGARDDADNKTDLSRAVKKRRLSSQKGVSDGMIPMEEPGGDTSSLGVQDVRQPLDKISNDENDSEEEWESGTVAEESEDVSDEDDGISSSDDLEKQGKKLVKPVTMSTSGMQSTFLPSLAVGFVRGDSDDSDWSKDEVNIVEPEKKNRRGQRARRAIWEKKYGKNANHKKKELEEKRGGKGEEARRRSHNKESKRATQRKPGSEALAVANTGGYKTEDTRVSHNPERPLHPSWEAKKRLKEKMSLGIVPSQGKKIVF